MSTIETSSLTTIEAAPTTLTPPTVTDAAPAKRKKLKRSAQVKKVGFFIHYVPDMAKAVAFFRSIGLKLKFESPEWTEFKAGIKFALHASDHAGEECSASSAEKRFTGITFSVKNLDKTYAAFLAAGITTKGEPRQVCEDGRSFEFEDPFGAVFSIYGE